MDTDSAGLASVSDRRTELDGTDVGDTTGADGSSQIVLGTVQQSEPGVINEILGEDERDLSAREFTLFGNVNDGRVVSASLVEERDTGEFGIYELDNEQLNTLVDSPYLQPAVTLDQTPAGEISVLDEREVVEEMPRRSSDSRMIEPANEGIGNRYAGAIIAAENDTLVQQVGDDLISHRADALEGVSVDPNKPVEISYEFDGPSVRTLEPEQDLSFER